MCSVLQQTGSGAQERSGIQGLPARRSPPAFRGGRLWVPAFAGTTVKERFHLNGMRSSGDEPHHLISVFEIFLSDRFENGWTGRCRMRARCAVPRRSRPAKPMSHASSKAMMTIASTGNA